MGIPETALDELLRGRGYTKDADDVSRLYEGRMLKYEKPVGDHGAEFDALVRA